MINTRVLAAILFLSVSGFGEEAANLVDTQDGDVPVLVISPHGGEEVVPGVKERSGKGEERIRDAYTYELAGELAKRLKDDLGGKPYLVRAKFDRKYIDANRPASEAYDDAAAKRYYDAFHAAIRRYVDEIRKRWPLGGLLIDLHGEGEIDGVVRGTRNGRTVKRLVERHGADAIVGADGLFGRIAAAGYDVRPAPGRKFGDPEEDARFNGGYDVGTYGSQNADGIDAVQLEIGPSFRKDEAKRKRLADDLARAIAGFYSQYVAK